MPNYDFHDLLEPLEFQDLICDIIQLRDNIFLETYKEGRDSGIDGSYTDNSKKIIVQAKRYQQDFKKLYSHLQYTELPKVRKLNPDRYILGVSADFKPEQKEKIIDLFKGYIINTSDILSRKDINRLLGEPAYKRIELSYPKLWLPSLTVFEKTLKESVNRAIYKESTEELKEAINTSKVFVPTRIYRKALNQWSQNHVIVISGEPGVGKTTMAYLLALSYLQPHHLDGFVWANSIHDVYAMLEDEQKQVIILDDFWGSIFQDESARRNDENRLDKLIRRIIESNGKKRLILTTREYILQQGLQKHPGLREMLDAYSLVCTMEEYGQDEKASILFRHLYASKLEYEYVYYFYENYEWIVHHENYNPRVLATFLSKEPSEGYSPQEYFDELCDYFDDPSAFWQSIFVELSPESQIVVILLLISSTPMRLGDIACCYNKYVHYVSHQIFAKSLGDIISELEKTMIKTIYSDEYDEILLKFNMPVVQDFLYQHIEENCEQYIPLLLQCCSFYNQLQFLLEHLSSKCSNRVANLIVEQCILHYQDYGSSLFEYDGSWNWDTDIYEETGHLDRFFQLLRCCEPEIHPALYHFLEKEIEKFCLTMGHGDREAQYTDLHNLPDIIVRCIHKGMSFEGSEIISKYKEEAFSAYHYLVMQKFQEVFPEEYKILDESYFQHLKSNIEDIIFSELDFLDDFCMDFEFDSLLDSIPDLLSKFGSRYTKKIGKKLFDLYGRKPISVVMGNNMARVYDDDIDPEERAIQLVKEDAEHWIFGPSGTYLEDKQILEMIIKSNLSPKMKVKLKEIQHCISPYYIYNFLETKESGELLIAALNDLDSIPELESNLYMKLLWYIGRENKDLIKKLVGFCAESFEMIMYREEPILRLNQFLLSDIYMYYLENDTDLSEIIFENLMLQDRQWLHFLHIPLFIFCNVLVRIMGSEDKELEKDYLDLWGENFDKYKKTSKSDYGEKTGIYYADIGTYYFKQYEWEGCMYRMFEELHPFHFNQSYVEPMLKKYLDDVGSGSDNSKVLKHVSLCRAEAEYTEKGFLNSNGSTINDELALIDHLAIANDWNIYPMSMKKNRLKELQKDGTVSQEDDKKWKILLYKTEDVELLKELGIYSEILRFINEVESIYSRFLDGDYSKIDRRRQ